MLIHSQSSHHSKLGGQQLGFTLIELVVSVTVFSIVLGAVYGLLQLARAGRLNVNQRTEVLQNVRVALNAIGRDAINAGVGYPNVGALIPDNKLSVIGVGPDADSTPDFLTPVYAGNDMNFVNGRTTDQVTFLYVDDSFNNGVSIPISAIGNPSGTQTLLTIQAGFNNASCNAGDLYLITGNNGSAIGTLTDKSGTNTLNFAGTDPLGINSPGAASAIDTIVTPASVLKLAWVTYYVADEDGNGTGTGIYAAQASLELMSRNFNKIFDTQLRPSAADLTNIENNKPNIDGFDFVQRITQSGSNDTKPIDDGDFAGLISLRTPYRLDSTSTYPNGAQVQLTRTFYNHQIPIFQFGIFYNDDMEFHPGPRFDFGGRVHSNGNIFMMSGADLFFRSRVTAVGQVVRDTARNGIKRGDPGWQWNGNVWVADAAANFQPVTKGSVIGGPDTDGTDSDMPNGTLNTSWPSVDSKPFNGNLLAGRRPLRLPLQINSNSDPIELVKRGRDANDYEVTVMGRPVDDEILSGSRYCNKPGIRISLSDSQPELPGGSGGVRLDGASNGLGGDQDGDGTRGYRPLTMNGGIYQPKRFNGHRLYTGQSYTDKGMPSSRQTWIKVELVTIDSPTLVVQARDITADFLSLGLTHKDPAGLNTGDDRAILKMQRYEVPGPPIKIGSSDLVTSTSNPTPAYTSARDPRDPNINGNPPPNRNVYTYNATAGYSYVTNSNLYMSDKETNGGAGYIVYVSDRRGDRDDDGEHDMEDIYGPNDGVFQAGEDVNHDGVLETDYDTAANNFCGESAGYNVAVETDLAAVRDHEYFRRGVRLINGETLLGTINKGYSVASENAIYVLGNYNGTGVSAVGMPTLPGQYTGAQAPASIVSDAITILSRNWKDGKSFRNPFRQGLAPGSKRRFAPPC